MTSNIRQALFQVLLLTTFSEEGSVIVDNGEQVMETDGGCNVQCTLCFKFLFPFYHYMLLLYLVILLFLPLFLPLSPSPLLFLSSSDQQVVCGVTWSGPAGQGL